MHSSRDEVITFCDNIAPAQAGLCALQEGQHLHAAGEICTPAVRDIAGHLLRQSLEYRFRDALHSDIVSIGLRDRKQHISGMRAGCCSQSVGRMSDTRQVA